MQQGREGSLLVSVQITSYSHLRDHLSAMEETIDIAQRKDNIMSEWNPKKRGGISNKELYIGDERVPVQLMKQE